MKHTFTHRLAEFFTERPGEWIDGRVLETIAGRYAWRSRVSDCRLELGMDIENRQRRMARPDGTKYVISEYRYVGEAFRLRSQTVHPSPSAG